MFYEQYICYYPGINPSQRVTNGCIVITNRETKRDEKIKTQHIHTVLDIWSIQASS